MANNRWTNVSGGNWNSTANWSLGALPAFDHGEKGGLLRMRVLLSPILVQMQEAMVKNALHCPAARKIRCC